MNKIVDDIIYGVAVVAGVVAVLWLIADFLLRNI
jgi:hypothetical protein